MRKHLLSPLTSVAMSLCLLLGILVADLTDTHGVTAAAAQNERLRGVGAVSNGTVVGRNIAATNVLVNGVATTAIFRGSVRVVDSVVFGGGSDVNGIFPHVSDGGGGGGTEVNGIFPHISDGLSAGGIFPHVADGEGTAADGIFPHVTEPTPDVSLTGGVVEGDNVRVVGGVITGQNLRVVGTVVNISRPAGVAADPGASSAS